MICWCSLKCMMVNHHFEFWTVGWEKKKICKAIWSDHFRFWETVWHFKTQTIEWPILNTTFKVFSCSPPFSADDSQVFVSVRPIIQISAAKGFQYCSSPTRWIWTAPCLLSKSRRCWVWRTSKTNPGTSGKISVKTRRHSVVVSCFRDYIMVTYSPWWRVEGHYCVVCYRWRL